MATPTPVGTTVGFPAHYGSHVRNLWSNANGDNVVVSPTAGNTLVAIVFGLKSYPPFDLLHGTPNSAYTPSLNDFAATPVITDTSADVSTVTNVAEAATALTLTAAGAAVSGTTTYTGTITGGGSNGLVGYYFTIAGFTNAGNNGYFICTASTTTTLALTNSGGISETHAGTATPDILTITASNNFSVGDVVAMAGLTSATFLNGQSLTVVTASGSSFTASDPTLHGTYASHSDTGTATRSGNDWAAAAGKVVLGDSDYTGTSSSQWSLDGYYPSVYIFYALNVTGGTTYKVNVNSCYQNGTTRPADLAAGKPIFDGGVDIVVLEFSGIVTSSATDGSTGAMSAANPAVCSSFTTTTAGDMILTAGIMKSAAAFSTYAPAGTTGTTMLINGACVGSEAHWGVQFQLQTSNGAITPGFTNPLGYEMAVAAVSLKHS